jgi:hypothetical protein
VKHKRTAARLSLAGSTARELSQAHSPRPERPPDGAVAGRLVGAQNHRLKAHVRSTAERGTGDLRCSTRLRSDRQSEQVTTDQAPSPNCERSLQLANFPRQGLAARRHQSQALGWSLSPVT